MAPRALNIQDRSMLNHMRLEDAGAFAEAAVLYKVYIAVRRTNAEALQYIGKAGYIPKMLDCKAKTADYDSLLNGSLYKTAGLVVDPNIVGAGAYRSGKHAKAMSEWEKFKPHLGPTAGADGRPWYLPADRSYLVQTDPASPHFGCVMYCKNGLRTAGQFIHGDYDLYAVVQAADKTSNIFVEEKRQGQPHARGKDLMDVQTYVNARIGAPMVRHGEQEHFSDSIDDEIDVFFPDGVTVKSYIGPAAIQQLYQTEFAGRPLHKAGTPTTPAGGLWKRG
ncbi:MAG: hypothetical protein KIT36_21810 [Alphaproteobacteria bacterium]|nr:hypothetical protein [Alphaproteobacteria bacterium]